MKAIVYLCFLVSMILTGFAAELKRGNSRLLLAEIEGEVEAEAEVEGEAELQGGKKKQPLDCTLKPPVYSSDQSFFTQEICDGLYAYSNFFYVSMFYVTNDGVIMVDAPPTFGANMLNVVPQVTTKPITHVVYSHHHTDHIGAADQYPANVKIYCHKNAVKYIASHVPKCTKTFGDRGFKLKVGGKKLILKHSGYRWHTNNDLIIYAKKAKTIMTVDLVFPGWAPFKQLALATDAQGYRDAHDYLLNNFEFDHFIGGHLDKVGNRDDVVANKQFYDDLKEAWKEAEHITSFGKVAEELGGFGPGKQWDIFNEFINQQTAECARIMLEDKSYGKKFLGAHAFMKDHCFTMRNEVDVRFG